MEKCRYLMDDWGGGGKELVINSGFVTRSIVYIMKYSDWLWNGQLRFDSRQKQTFFITLHPNQFWGCLLNTFFSGIKSMKLTTDQD
jgi:hypothetical protein